MLFIGSEHRAAPEFLRQTHREKRGVGNQGGPQARNQQGPAPNGGISNSVEQTASACGDNTASLDDQAESENVTSRALDPPSSTDCQTTCRRFLLQIRPCARWATKSSAHDAERTDE